MHHLEVSLSVCVVSTRKRVTVLFLGLLVEETEVDVASCSD